MSTSTYRHRLNSYWRSFSSFWKAHPSLPYLLWIGGTVIYIFFLGDHTIMRLVKSYARERELREQYAIDRPRYEADSARLSELKNNKELIERIAREHYYMHLPGEEIFILRPDTASAAPTAQASSREP